LRQLAESLVSAPVVGFTPFCFHFIRVERKKFIENIKPKTNTKL
jgi:hypothetical protein